MKQIIIDKNQCIGCGSCSKVCVAHNIILKDRKACIVKNACILCGQCFAVCPEKAISISGYKDTVKEKTGNVQLDANQILDVIRFRRSIRNFKTAKIPQEVTEQILEAGRLTHTAKNLQDVSFVVLDREKERMEKMAVQLFRAIRPFAALFVPMARKRKIEDHFFFFDAPMVIVVLAKDKTNGILASQNMEFVAEANGVGVLYSGFFTAAANVSRKIRNALEIPKGKKVAMTLVLGYPEIKYLRSTPHKELDVKYM